MFQGMAFIHDSVIETHGRLRSSNVYVDSRWMCKVGDFPMPNFCDGEKTRDDEKNSESFSKSFCIEKKMFYLASMTCSFIFKKKISKSLHSTYLFQTFC